MNAERPSPATLSKPTDPWPWPWMPPWVPSPTFPDPDGPWLLMSAGELHGRFVRRFWNDARAVKEDRRTAMLASVQELEHRKAVTAAEAERLGRIVDALFEEGDALKTCQEIGRVLVDEEAGTFARAVADIAVDSLERGTHGLSRPGIPAARPATEDVHGALVGGIFGLELGGPFGALVGMLAGGIAASAAEAWG